jgi:cell wall-associated NlpC family hydrolase
LKLLISKKTSKMLSYAESLVGIPYRWWNPAVSCADETGPFYAVEGDEVPLETIQKGHINCAGLLNVICRKFGIEIPGAKEKYFYAGGTRCWWLYFQAQDRIEPFDAQKEYPKGTLLLRDFKQQGDEGHIAIVYDKRRIIHAWPEKGVVIEECDSTYYEGVVLGFLKESS